MPALNADQMQNLLISASDLPGSPQGYSTYSGLSYFEDHIAVASTVYEETFGATECAEAMDSINVDLVGEDAQDGVINEFQLQGTEADEGEEPTPLLYAWVISYDRSVDSSPVWKSVIEHCDGAPLENGADHVEVQEFNGSGFTGVGLHINLTEEGQERTIEGYSATADAGENLVMISAVHLGEEEFRELLESQSERITAAGDSFSG